MKGFNMIKLYYQIRMINTEIINKKSNFLYDCYKKYKTREEAENRIARIKLNYPDLIFKIIVVERLDKIDCYRKLFRSDQLNIFRMSTHPRRCLYSLWYYD